MPCWSRWTDSSPMRAIILSAATNRTDSLDAALWCRARHQGVRRNSSRTRKVPISEDVDLSVIARGTPGFSGADLANLVNEAPLWAARQNRKLVMMADFEMSKDKVLMG